MPDVPADMVPEIGRACARAILAALKWPDKDADAMTERVVEQMKADMIEEERELRRMFGAGRNDRQDQAQPPEGAGWDRRRRKGDLDDDIPF